MRPNRLRGALTALLLASVPFSAIAQQTPGVVGIITGMRTGTYAATGADLMTLDDDNLYVLPMLGKGSLMNLRDLLYTRGVDIAFIQADAVPFAKAHNLFPDKDLSQIQYIAKLYDEDVHVIARPGINTLADLEGKRINTDVAGSGSAMTAEIVLSAFGVKPIVSHMPQSDAIGALRRGDLDAIIHVGGPPIPLLADIPAGDLHMVPVELSHGLDDTYLPTEITSKQYPSLIPDGQSVSTIAIGDVMAVYGWPYGSERYRNVARFVDALFSHIADLQKPPRFPGWKQVNLSAEMPGWARFPAAEAYVRKTPDRRSFDAFIDAHGAKAMPQDARDKLFKAIQAYRTEAIAPMASDQKNAH